MNKQNNIQLNNIVNNLQTIYKKKAKIWWFLFALLLVFSMFIVALRLLGRVEHVYDGNQENIFYLESKENSSNDTGISQGRLDEQRFNTQEIISTNRIQGQNGNHVTGSLSVFDDIETWDNQVSLQIFQNSYFKKYDNMIAPGVKGTYNFSIRNNTNLSITYQLNLSEDNGLGVNMKYRLKLDGQYISGDDNYWVRPSDIRLDKLKLNTNDGHKFQLEWKWDDVDDEKDTSIGKQGNTEYKLFMNIYAEGI